MTPGDWLDVSPHSPPQCGQWFNTVVNNVTEKSFHFKFEETESNPKPNRKNNSQTRRKEKREQERKGTKEAEKNNTRTNNEDNKIQKETQTGETKHNKDNAVSGAAGRLRPEGQRLNNTP